MKRSETKEANGIFNRRKVTDKKREAIGVFNEVKRFFSSLHGWDYFFIILAVILGIATFTDIFGETGRKFAAGGAKVWAKIKQLGFWKVLFLSLLILFIADRIVVGINRAKKQREAELAAAAAETATTENSSEDGKE